jgi:GTP cyclohydrolase I
MSQQRSGPARSGVVLEQRVATWGRARPEGNPLQDAFRKIIEEVGEDLSRPGLCRTPERAAEAFRFLPFVGKGHVAYLPNGKRNRTR